MLLEALKLLEWRQEGILVVQPHHEPDRNLIVLKVIEERTAIGLAIERPAHGVNDGTGLVLGLIDFPKLLEGDAVGLRIAVLAQGEPLEQALGE